MSCNAMDFLSQLSEIISGQSSPTGAIAGGVAAGAALLFAAPAIWFAYWRRRRPPEHFFDVPGMCFNFVSRKRYNASAMSVFLTLLPFFS